jgi:hypothetical protein
VGRGEEGGQREEIRGTKTTFTRGRSLFQVRSQGYVILLWSSLKIPCVLTDKMPLPLRPRGSGAGQGLSLQQAIECFPKGPWPAGMQVPCLCEIYFHFRGQEKCPGEWQSQRTCVRPKVPLSC